MTKVIDGIMKQYDLPVEELLNDSSVFIEEVLFYGLYIIDIMTTEDEKVNNISTKVLILMLRDMLENMDTVSILIKNGCTNGSMPILRTVLELYLSIAFMTDDDSENRAITYDVCHIYKKLNAGEVLRERGVMVEDTIKLLKEKLEEPGYSNASRRWEKYKNTKGHPPNWYNITKNECSSIRQLAKKTGKMEMYNVVYSYFSMYAHGVVSLINHNYQVGQLKITPLRNPHMVSLTCRHCLSLATEVYCRFVEKYLNTDDKDNLDKWYLARRKEVAKIIAKEEAISLRLQQSISNVQA